MRTNWILAALLAPGICWAEGDSYRPGDEAMVPAPVDQNHPAPRDGADGRDGRDGKDGSQGPQDQPGAPGASGVVVHHHYTHQVVLLRGTQPTYEARSRKDRAIQWAALSRVNGTAQAAANDATNAQCTADLALSRADSAHQRIDTAEAQKKREEDTRNQEKTLKVIAAALIAALLLGILAAAAYTAGARQGG